ncbi:MAG: hypothetical protein RLZZ338_1495 [Cyanobacteriota bacterium]|jgi:hypothetical protein
METPFQINFSTGQTANAVMVDNFSDLPNAVQNLGLQKACPIIVLVGGASGIHDRDMISLRQMFVEVLAPRAQSLGAIVVDGGTDAGIMQLMGNARAQMGGTFPLIGVAAIGTVVLPDTTPMRPDAAALEPNHTHFVLVPGSNWGDESPWLASLASELSQGKPSLTVVINGGEITWQDVEQSIKVGRPVLTIAGSGRTADKIAAALAGKETDERAKDLIASGQVNSIDLIKGGDPLAQAITGMLFQENQEQKQKMASKKDPYKEWLKEDFGKIFEMLKLNDLQKHFLRSRWLDQVLWMEGKAAKARNRHYLLKVTTIIGGVLLPALVTLNNSENPEIRKYIYWATFGISLLVSTTSSLEGFFLYGDQWRNYRRSVESLKTLGWQYFQLSGPYLSYKTHEEAFNAFAAQVEDVIQRDVEVYATQIAQQQKAEKDADQQKAEKDADPAKIEI